MPAHDLRDSLAEFPYEIDSVQSFQLGPLRSLPTRRKYSPVYRVDARPRSSHAMSVNLAVKVFPGAKGRGDDARREQQFITAGKIWQTSFVKIPEIAKAHGVYRLGDAQERAWKEGTGHSPPSRVVCVMDWHGESLERTPKGLRPEVARLIAIAVARALNAIHEKGYVHRDVNLRNILLSDDGRCVLCDLGLLAPHGVDDPQNPRPRRRTSMADKREDFEDYADVLTRLSRNCPSLKKPFDHVAAWCRDQSRSLSWEPVLSYFEEALERREGRETQGQRTAVFLPTPAADQDLEQKLKTRQPQAREKTGLVVWVVGDGGSGKTDYLSRWCQPGGETFLDLPGVFLDFEQDLPIRLRNDLVEPLSLRFLLPQLPGFDEADQLRDGLRSWLKTIVDVHGHHLDGKRRWVRLFVDGLDRVADPRAILSWLPWPPPAGVAYVISARPELRERFKVSTSGLVAQEILIELKAVVRDPKIDRRILALRIGDLFRDIEGRPTVKDLVERQLALVLASRSPPPSLKHDPDLSREPDYWLSLQECGWLLKLAEGHGGHEGSSFPWRPLLAERLSKDRLTVAHARLARRYIKTGGQYEQAIFHRLQTGAAGDLNMAIRDLTAPEFLVWAVEG